MGESSEGSREEAEVWVIDNQLGRRNLEPIQRIELAERRREALAARAKRNLGGDHKSAAFREKREQAEIKSVKNDQLDSPTPQPTTRAALAQMAGVSTGQYAQYEQVKKKRPELLAEVRSGALTIGGAYKAEA